MNEPTLRTYLEYSIASLQTVMEELCLFESDGNRYIDCFCELEQAEASINRARKCLREAV